jgi:hypothetical protein
MVWWGKKHKAFDHVLRTYRDEMTFMDKIDLNLYKSIGSVHCITHARTHYIHMLHMIYITQTHMHTHTHVAHAHTHTHPHKTIQSTWPETTHKLWYHVFMKSRLQQIIYYFLTVFFLKSWVWFTYQLTLLDCTWSNTTNMEYTHAHCFLLALHSYLFCGISLLCIEFDVIYYQ